MKKLIAVLLLFAILLVFTSCDETQYFRCVKWNVSIKDFEERYIPLYEEQLSLLSNKYALEYERLTEIDKDEHKIIFVTYLYNEEYTIKIVMNNEVECALYEIILRYYGSEENSLADYESQRKAVNFINDFTNYAAFDTISEENRLEKLYSEAQSASDLRAFDKYHFDNHIGSVGYFVALNDTSSGYYYMMQKDSSLEILCNSYGFEGILKPIE